MSNIINLNACYTTIMIKVFEKLKKKNTFAFVPPSMVRKVSIIQLCDEI